MEEKNPEKTKCEGVKKNSKRQVKWSGSGRTELEKKKVKEKEKAN